MMIDAWFTSTESRFEKPECILRMFESNYKQTKNIENSDLKLSYKIVDVSWDVSFIVVIFSW